MSRLHAVLRTVVEILKTFEDVLGGTCGKAPSYTTVRNWMLKGSYCLSMTMTRAAMKYYAIIQDESLTVNRQKLLLTLGIPPKHPGRAFETF